MTGSEEERAGAPDPELEKLRDEMERIRTRKTSTGSKLLTLLITGAVFLAIAGFQWEPEELAILVAVLLFHEAGHAAGMFLFGYKNVSMFFLPGFGAAVSGRKESAPAWQEALVSLAGPLPGLLLALALWPLNAALWQSQLVESLILYLAFLNALNLLPFYPLDGGHFFNHVLFSRHAYLEAAFSILGVFGLVALAFLLESWFIGIFSLLALSVAIRSVKLRLIARDLEPADAEAPFRAGDPLLRQIDEQVRARLDAKDLKLRATGANQVLERMGRRPPGALATILLLLLYLAPIPLFGVSAIAVGTIGAGAQAAIDAAGQEPPP